MPGTITVRLFARLAQLAGTREVQLEIGEGLTAGDAYRLLVQRDGSLAGFESSVAYAVNQEYVGAETMLKAGDELALIPPVSGGCAQSNVGATLRSPLRLERRGRCAV
jgi:molybdopterin converting factor subunit 1